MIRIKFNGTPTDSVGSCWSVLKLAVCWWRGYGPSKWEHRGLGVVINGAAYSVAIWTK